MGNARSNFANVPGAVDEDLHEGHMGITRMKSVARSFCWWPGLDKDRGQRAAVRCAKQREVPLPW